MRTLDTDALVEACREVARSTLWQGPDPSDIDDVIDTDQIEKAIKAYYAIAMRHALELAEGSHDPNVVTRAIRYLAHEHAIPPMKDDTTWFEHYLEVLMRLIQPTSFGTREAAQFMDDLETAARAYREEAFGRRT